MTTTRDAIAYVKDNMIEKDGAHVLGSLGTQSLVYMSSTRTTIKSLAHLWNGLGVFSELHAMIDKAVKEQAGQLADTHKSAVEGILTSPYAEDNSEGTVCSLRAVLGGAADGDWHKDLKAGKVPFADLLKVCDDTLFQLKGLAFSDALYRLEAGLNVYTTACDQYECTQDDAWVKARRAELTKGLVTKLEAVCVRQVHKHRSTPLVLRTVLQKEQEWGAACGAWQHMHRSVKQHMDRALSLKKVE